MSLLSPISGTAHGFKAYLRGVGWLRRHPRYLVYLSVPIVIGLSFVVAAMSWFATYDQTLLTWILPAAPEAWYWVVLYNIAKVLLYVAVFVLSLVSALLLMNVIASPIYEVVSVAVERDFTGGHVESLNFWDSFKTIVTELKKVFLILSISIVLLFIPGFNVISTLVAAFLVGWDFFDYPVARRGWKLRQRLSFVGGRFWQVLGFGVWLVIPFAQIVMMPLAVAGGTLLNLEALAESGQLTHYRSKEGAHDAISS
jgi:CysZ protein